MIYLGTTSFIRRASRAFHATSFLNQKDAAPLYSIAGALLSVADIRNVKPEARTVAHWRVLVDWDLQSTRPYVVVDPFDPRGLLYLTRGEYLLQSRVSLANDLTLIVIARPGDVAPLPSSSKIPPSNNLKEGLSSTKYFSNRHNRLAWKDFIRLRNFASFNVKVDEGMVSVNSKSIERAVLVWGRQLLHYSGVTAPERRLSGFLILTGHLRKVLTCNGPQTLVKRLKIELFSIYSYISGNPLSSTQDLGMRVRLRSGLPVRIPASYRKLIREGDMTWIRIWVSIYNIYRAIKVKTPDPETAYKTIRRPLPVWFPKTLEEFIYFTRYVFPSLVKERASRNQLEYKPFTYTSALGTIIRSAGTNLRGTSSIFSIILDAQAWFHQPKNFVLEWFRFHGDFTAAALMSAISREDHYGSLIDEYNEWSPPPAKSLEDQLRIDSLKENLISEGKSEGVFAAYVQSAWKLAREVKGVMHNSILGRLFNFDAPGGKLRTVAICDYWTQIAMKPVHDHLFYILKLLKGNDATFDQQGCVDDYFDRNLSPHWSFDLSAATDSIPIILYKYVLAPFLQTREGSYAEAYECAELWANIMTNRDFAIPSPRKGEIGHTGNTQYRSIRYATGQPMGALSSWASMALVHHALVQFAHWQRAKADANISVEWFDTYMVLGDDVDIANCEATALNYQKACADFSIKIGLAKSLKSNSNFFEFANQRFCPKGNISPLSFMEEVVSNTWTQRVEFASRIAKRFGVRMSPHSLFRISTSSRQWQLLIPELTGKRSRILSKFLDFILLGPLVPVWHSSAPISIESIFKWVQKLESSLLEPHKLSIEDQRNFETALCNKVADRCQRIIDTLSERLSTRRDLPRTETARMQASIHPSPLSTIPLVSVHLLSVMNSFAHYYLPDEDKYSENFLTAYGYLEKNNINKDKSHSIDHSELSLIRTLFKNFDTTNIRVPKKCPVAFLYLYFCAFKHNESLQRQISEFSTILFGLRKEIRDREIPMQLFSRLVGNKPSPLAKLIHLYLELSGLPQAIRLDLDGITPSSIGIKSEKKVPQDVAFELIVDIIPLLAEYAGLRLHHMPHFPSRGNVSWRTLNRLIRLNRKVIKERQKVKYSVLKQFSPHNAPVLGSLHMAINLGRPNLP